jgi:hypothetical protein
MEDFPNKLMVFIFMLQILSFVNCIQSEKFGNMKNAEKEHGKGAWGFEKNIINIDTFFANPLKHDGNGDPIEDYE